MANTAMPWGANAPLNVLVGIESTFDTFTSTPLFIRQEGIPDIGAMHLYMIPDPSMRGDLNAVHVHIPGVTGALDPGTKLTLVHRLFGLQSETPNATDMAGHATDATGHPLCLLLDCFFGSETACDLYTITTVTGCSKTDLTVSADPAGFTLGGGFVIDSSEAGTTGAVYEAAFAKTLTTGPPAHIIPRVTLLRTPDTAGGAIIYGGITYYPASKISKSVSMRVVGPLVDTTTPLYLQLSGIGVDTLTIAGKSNEVPLVTWGLIPTSHAWTDASAVGASVQTWSYPQPEQLAGGGWTIDGSAVRMESFELSLSRGLSSIDDANGAHGRTGFVATGGTDGIGTLKLEITADETIAQTLRTAQEAQSTVSVQGWQGSAPGKMWALAIPAAHIAAMADPTDLGGKYGISLTLRPTAYTGDTGTSSECGDQPLYFWLG